MSFNVTSGGTDTGAPPTRDCDAEVVEKHFVRNGWEKAGTRKVGRDAGLTGSRRSCVKHRFEAAQAMLRC
jgi:hypothetical protein